MNPLLHNGNKALVLLTPTATANVPPSLYFASGRPQTLSSLAERKGLWGLYFLLLKDHGELQLPKKSQDGVSVATVAATAAAICVLFDFWLC